MMKLVRRHPIMAFFVLAYTVSWAAGYLEVVLSPTRSVPLWLALIVLFGPAMAAEIVLALTEGRQGLKKLMDQLMLWRVGWQWYVVALSLPVGLNYLVVGLNNILPGAPPVGAWSMFVPARFLFSLTVLGEEIGWRGYALPKLLGRWRPLTASIILGLLWAFWHAPTFYFQSNIQYGHPFLPYVFIVVALSIFHTWIFVHVRGSLLVASLFHWTTNIAAIIPGFIEPERQASLFIITYGVAVGLLLLAFGPGLRRRE